MRIGSKKFKIGERLPLPYLFMAGMAVGLILMTLGRTTLFEETGLLNEESLYQMKYMTVDRNALFWYILGIRFKNVAILAVLATTYLGLAAVCTMTISYGAAAGMFLAAAMMRYGVKGILLAVTAIFPRYLLYVPAFFFLLVWCEQICRGIYFEKGARLGSKQMLLVKLLQLLGIIAVVIIGCGLESYVNPTVLKNLLKIF